MIVKVEQSYLMILLELSLPACAL